MIINYLKSENLFKADSWSITQLLPKEEIIINSQYTLVPLGKLVKERSNNKQDSFSEYVNYIGLENIESNTGRLINFEQKKTSSIKSLYKKYYKGDILFGRLRPNLNKIWLNDKFENGGCTTEIIVLIPNEDLINSIYLCEILRSKKINNQIVNLIKGASLPRVKINDLYNLEIPVPCIEIQEQLVNKLIEKRVELEECYKRISLIPQEINNLLLDSYSKL